MDERTHIGLDVHQDTIAVAVLRPGERAADERVIPATPEALRGLVKRMGEPSSLAGCYEAGPTGYDTYRLLTGLGVATDVCAPSLTPRRPGSRVKTDRLDARMLARLHRAGELALIRVPTPAEEAVRDLVRAREDLKDDRRRAQQRVKSFLLKAGRRYPGPTRGWSGPYDRWVRAQGFSEQAAQVAFSHLLAARDARAAELAAIEHDLESFVAREPLATAVGKLGCLRGVALLTAATVAAETCDPRRFTGASAFMAFTGLVPSEHSSGAREHRGAITKTGNRHLRRVLVEAAWSYRHRPAVGEKLRARQQGQPAWAIARAWEAQLRLHRVFRRVAERRGANKAVVAVARELAGYCWDLMVRER